MSQTSELTTWLVKSSGEVHTVEADGWVAGQSLNFHRDGRTIAVFNTVEWWKEAIVDASAEIQLWPREADVLAGRASADNPS